MSKFDDLISRALSDEDRALLASHSEPGYLTQAFGIFRGPQAWVMWLINLVGGIAFAVGVYAFWRMLGAPEAALAVKWGIASLFLFQMTALNKSFMGHRVEINRVLRELKRVELQLSLLRADSPK